MLKACAGSMTEAGNFTSYAAAARGPCRNVVGGEDLTRFVRGGQFSVRSEFASTNYRGFNEPALVTLVGPEDL
jgi:hypothetical protein